MNDNFSKILSKAKDGMRITLTRDNVAPNDGFLNFRTYKQIVVTFHMKHVPFSLDFDGDEPILLENCPESFLESLLMNM